MSSAYCTNVISDVTMFDISYVSILNNMGDSIEPWGKPIDNVLLDEYVFVCVCVGMCGICKEVYRGNI